MWKWIVNHNIWNKVVAAGIISAMAFLISFIYGLLTKVPFTQLFSEIIFFKIPVWVVFISFFLLNILFAFYNKLFTKSEKIDSRTLALINRKKKFAESRNKLTHDECNVIYRFRTYFASNTNLPAILGLKIYCTLHPIPLEFDRTRCTDFNCPNSRERLDLQVIQKGIESQFIHEWEEENGLLFKSFII